MNKIRLNKFISDSGICSRREADRYIEKGQVLVNRKKATIGTLVSSEDEVLLNGLLIEAKEKDQLVVIAFNKPRGIVTTTEKEVSENIIKSVGYHERIFPIGRLDKDSQGLIFLTNNGDIVNKILRAGNMHEKEYLVTVNKPISDEFIQGMSNGVPILGVMTKKCVVEKITDNVFRIILVQGLNRQIRRMCEYFNYNVLKLERIRIMHVNLKGIAIGDWRFLTEAEMILLNNAISSSDNMVHKESHHSTGTSKKRLSSSQKTLKDFEAAKKKEKSVGTSNKSKKDSLSFHNPKSKELRGKGKKDFKITKTRRR